MKLSAKLILIILTLFGTGAGEKSMKLSLNKVIYGTQAGEKHAELSLNKAIWDRSHGKTRGTVPKQGDMRHEQVKNARSCLLTRRYGTRATVKRAKLSLNKRFGTAVRKRKFFHPKTKKADTLLVPAR
ncbi:hypothetical protein [Bacillus sp. Marseille-Q3570]|uniref:hypothetical protein n=1 Tax=Bacillus sp. Marseille-Q3570 TaxID=2963522 RepID=UPI0021B70AE3|nr:hypothetical protein [Bacillus sp. Marseille-Q3570]